MLLRLGEKYQCRGLKQRIDVFERNGERRRWAVYALARHNSEEFVDTGPGNGPRRTALRQPGDAVRRRLMKRSILPVRVDEDVGVEGYHPPRPSYARSRIFSQSASRNSGTSPSPLNVTTRNLKGRSAFRSATILRNPCSTSSRRVVRSRVAIFRASRNNGSDISSVVFTAHIPVCCNMGSNIMIVKSLPLHYFQWTSHPREDGVRRQARLCAIAASPSAVSVSGRHPTMTSFVGLTISCPPS
jgi:hypothetical protein